MYPKLSPEHEKLHELKAAQALGLAHYQILKAENDWFHLCYEEPKEVLDPIRETAFGSAVGAFEIYWLSNHIDNISDFEIKVKQINDNLIKLKREAEKISKEFEETEYGLIVDRLVQFTRENEEEIIAFTEVINWLAQVDVLGPQLFFLVQRGSWSSTQASYRMLTRELGPLTPDVHNKCIDIVFGLFTNNMYTYESVMSDRYMELEDYMVYENPSYVIIYDSVKNRIRHTIMQEFYTYFEKMRVSCDLIIDILSRYIYNDIVFNDDFLIKFITESIKREEMETRLWDFKRTIDAWHNPRIEKLKIDFMKNLAAYANRDGGILVVGISDDRNIIGVDDLEGKIQQSRDWIKSYMGEMQDKIRIITSVVNNGTSKNILLLFVMKQTKDKVVVKDGVSELYLIRDETKIAPISSRELDELKKDIVDDNYLFVRDIFDFVYNSKRV
jgi:hypothetical protein